MPGEAPDPLRAMAAALDVVPDHVVVLAEDGRILHSNAAWRRFARENGGDRDWSGVDYLAVGDAVGPGDGDPDPMSRGIRDVLAGRRDLFEHEYDCHAPDELRWYRMTATRVDVRGVGAVIAHRDVSGSRTTASVLGRRATHDALTGVLAVDVIDTHARHMITEGRGVTVVRVRLHDEPTRDLAATLARAAATLEGLFPAPAVIGRTEHGLVVVQGGETDEELLDALGATYRTFAADFPQLRVTITGERLSRGSDAPAGAPSTEDAGAGREDPTTEPPVRGLGAPAAPIAG